jgi:hypothetical protein
MQQSIANSHRTSQFSTGSASPRSMPRTNAHESFLPFKKKPTGLQEPVGGWITLLRWLERQLQTKLHLPRSSDGEDARAGSRTD